MEREANAKVVASVWGAEFVQFFAALAVLPWSILKKRSKSSYFSKLAEAKQLARQGNEQILPPNIILYFFYAAEGHGVMKYVQ